VDEKQVKSLKLAHWAKENKILTDCLKTVEFLILTALVLLGLSGLNRHLKITQINFLGLIAHESVKLLGYQLGHIKN